MAIKLSLSKHIDALAADLSAPAAVTREAAVARLTIIGTRAVERLIAIVSSDASADARSAALRALDAIGDPRGRAAILHALADPDAAVASTAAAAAGNYLRGPHGAEVLDHLTRAAVDSSRSGSVRTAALRAMRELDPATIAPLLDSLRNDADGDVRTAAAWIPGSAAAGTRSAVETLEAAANGDLPSDPAELRGALADAGRDAPLPTLLHIVEGVRAREGVEPPATQAAWTAVRAAAHLALATRGSRIALYDLRDTLSTTSAGLPVEWLAALAAVGDSSCLEPLVAAHARTTDPWWREHVGGAFRAIVERERLTRRHAVIRKIGARWSESFAAVWTRRS